MSSGYCGEWVINIEEKRIKKKVKTQQRTIKQHTQCTHTQTKHTHTHTHTHKHTHMYLETIADLKQKKKK